MAELGGIVTAGIASEDSNLERFFLPLDIRHTRLCISGTSCSLSLEQEHRNTKEYKGGESLAGGLWLWSDWPIGDF